MLLFERNSLALTDLSDHLVRGPVTCSIFALPGVNALMDIAVQASTLHTMAGHLKSDRMAPVQVSMLSTTQHLCSTTKSETENNTVSKATEKLVITKETLPDQSQGLKTLSDTLISSLRIPLSPRLTKDLNLTEFSLLDQTEAQQSNSCELLAQRTSYRSGLRVGLWIHRTWKSKSVPPLIQSFQNSKVSRRSSHIIPILITLGRQNASLDPTKCQQLTAVPNLCLSLMHHLSAPRRTLVKHPKPALENQTVSLLDPVSAWTMILKKNSSNMLPQSPAMKKGAARTKATTIARMTKASAILTRTMRRILTVQQPPSAVSLLMSSDSKARGFAPKI